MNLTTVILEDGNKPIFMCEMGMVKRINKKLVLKYSPKEQPNLSPKGLKSLYKISCRCYYCGRITTLPEGGSSPNKKNTATIDHKTPKCRDGKDDVKNRVLCCNQCNGDKAHLTEGEYQAVLAYRQSLTDN